MYAWYVTVSLVTRLSPHKQEEEVTSGKEVVDFLRLALAVPIRLQNETTCTRCSVWPVHNNSQHSKQVDS